MTLLHKSKRILNIFGHCGSSQSVPLMDGYPLAKLIESKDALSPLAKLQIAIQMAKSIADLHGYKYGPIVHGDVQYVQWMLDQNNNVVLVDLNRAEPLLWDEENGEYCKYFTGGASGTVRAPEEYKQELLDEKIDIYSFGIVLYTILTAEDPYQEVDDMLEEILLMNRPIVPIEIRNRSQAEMIMADVMDSCFEYDLDKRIDIFTAVSTLERTLHKYYGSVENIEIEWDVEDSDSGDFEEDDEPIDPYYHYQHDDGSVGLEYPYNDDNTNGVISGHGDELRRR